MYHLPPLKALVAFNAVAQTKHFANAAKKLNVTPGAISQQIKILEQFLGCQLFTRNTKNVVLTNQGQIYYQEVHQALLQIENATTHIKPADQNTIQIKMMATLALQWLIPCMSDFYINHPDISINLMTSIDADKAADEQVDFNIILSEQKPKDKAQKLWQDSLVLVYSNKHFNKSNIHKAAAIIVNQALRQHDWQDYCQKSQHPMPEKTLSVTSTAQAIQAAINGLGVFVTHLPFVHQLVQSKTLSIYQKPVTTPYAYYLVEGNHLIYKQAKNTVREWLLTQADQYM
ncbi:LysR family transcriptional regulator [Facilibium subflavum]|uniref:LysR family transcriptional regulator n=1 Tax=Facilibium subflavum TaxID=2219058 RepID=UPI000E651F99|nr:LysR family transcriptional regulator [Facilibium subflavum]